jgi:lipopolysaccharide/colanic/teichoic acid biosynthesis glycosyltransferase
MKPWFSHRLVASDFQALMTDHDALTANSASATRTTQRAQAALRVKRSLDVTLGVVLGAVALPAMLLIAAAIRLDSPGPVLFCAKRIGRHGKLFCMYKFRTMVEGAEERLHEFAHLNVANGMVKIPNDPRVTRTGKWLRRFSLDELPQVYNVIVGHMSLVGPRPHDVGDLPAHELEQDLRLGMRPGLTGLWQVTARSDPRLESRVHFDLHYVARWSLLLDVKILAKTIPAVVLGEGGKVSLIEQVASSLAYTVAPTSRSRGSNGSVHPDLSGNGVPQPIEGWASPEASA